MEKPNIKAEKSKVKHKETKLKNETLKSVIKGIHKLELRENYCKDSIFEEDFVLLIELCSDELVLLRFYI